jgi:hypothetical protein
VPLRLPNREEVNLQLPSLTTATMTKLHLSVSLEVDLVLVQSRGRGRLRDPSHLVLPLAIRDVVPVPTRLDAILAPLPLLVPVEGTTLLPDLVPPLVLDRALVHPKSGGGGRRRVVRSVVRGLLHRGGDVKIVAISVRFVTRGGGARVLRGEGDETLCGSRSFATL